MIDGDMDENVFVILIQPQEGEDLFMRDLDKYGIDRLFEMAVEKDIIYKCKRQTRKISTKINCH